MLFSSVTAHRQLYDLSLTLVFLINQGKLPLSGIAVNRLEDDGNMINSFEITGEWQDGQFLPVRTSPCKRYL